MKKLLLSLLLLNLFILPIYGESFSSDGDYQISLSYIQQPTYSVLIPKEINCTSNSTILPYFVKGDIYADQNLIVRFDEQTFLTYLNTQIPVYVTQSRDTYSYSELNDDYLNQEVLLTHNKLSPGSYSGKLSVAIYLEEGA